MIETTKAIYVINPLPGGVISKYHEVNNGSKHNDISHPHVIVKKAPNDQYSCPHRRSPISNQTTSLLYSDVVKSLLPSPDHESNFLSSQVNHQVQSQGRRIKRSLSNEFPEEEDTDSIGNSGSKVGVTVETAVFVDETLYEIMRRTYPGLWLLLSLHILISTHFLRTLHDKSSFSTAKSDLLFQNIFSYRLPSSSSFSFRQFSLPPQIETWFKSHEWLTKHLFHVLSLFCSWYRTGNCNIHLDHHECCPIVVQTSLSRSWRVHIRHPHGHPQDSTSSKFCGWADEQKRWECESESCSNLICSWIMQMHNRTWSLRITLTHTWPTFVSGNTTKGLIVEVWLLAGITHFFFLGMSNLLSLLFPSVRLLSAKSLFAPRFLFSSHPLLHSFTHFRSFDTNGTVFPKKEYRYKISNSFSVTFSFFRHFCRLWIFLGCPFAGEKLMVHSYPSTKCSSWMEIGLILLWLIHLQH